MNSQERHKEKRRIKRLYTVAFVLVGGILINFITIFKLSADQAPDLTIALVGIVGLVLPAMASLMFGMYAGWAKQKLMSEFTRLYNKKNMFYFRRFYEAVIANDLEEARKRFNMIAVRSDTLRTFAHGIIITLMRMSGDDKNVRKAEERMSDILNS